MRIHVSSLAVVLLAGCASGGGQPPADASGGAQDFSVSDDLAVDTSDLAVADAGGGDAGSGGACTKVAAWPAIGPLADYNAMTNETRLLSARQMMSPLDILSVEDWHTMTGETYPKNVTFDANSRYGTCDVCVRLVAGCTQTGCGKMFFAQAGTVDVAAAGTNAAAGHMAATGAGLKLVEWSFDPSATPPVDAPVANGQCWEIASFNLDVPWNNLPDGGVDLAGVDLGGGDLAGVDLGGGAACAPKINEVMTSTTQSASEEFVELYNPCSFAIDLTGWKLVYRSATNITPVRSPDSASLFKFNAVTIPASGFLVYGGTNFRPGADAGQVDGRLLSGLADSGAVGLRDPTANLVDSVAYGAVSAGNAFIEGTMPAPAPTKTASPGSSIIRKPDGADQNVNATDFIHCTVITPDAPNM